MEGSCEGREFPIDPVEEVGGAEMFFDDCASFGLNVG
jgi:hypothetical protein